MEEEILVDFQFNDGDVKEATKLVSEFSKTEQQLLETQKQLVTQNQKNSQAFSDNAEKLKGVTAKVSENSKIVQANSQANKQNTDNLKQYSSALSVVSPGLGNFAGNLGSATKASGGLTSGIFSMVKASLAFIATPIGAIIAALVLAFKLLETYVTGSTEGMDKFEDVMSAISTIADVVTDRIVKLVGGIGKLLSGDFSGGLDDIENSFSGIGDEIQREIDLTLELNSAIRSLEDAEINYDIAASKTSNTIKELLLQAKNRTLSEKERIALLTQATELEANQNKQNIANKQEALRIANEEANKRVQIARIAGETEDQFAQRLLDTGLLLDDQRDHVKDSIIAFNGALGEGIAVREKVQNQIDALNEKAEEAAKKRADAEVKRLEDLAKKREEIAARDKKALDDLDVLRLQSEAKDIKDAETRAEKLIEIENLKRENLLENTKLTESERQLIVAQSEETIKQINIDSIAAQKVARDEDFAEALESFKDLSQELINEKKNQLLEGTISQEEYNQELADLNIAALEAERVVREQFGEEDLQLNARITDAKIALSKTEADAKIADENRKKAAVISGLGTVAAAFNKQSIAFKLLSSAQTLISTYESAVKAFDSLAGIPYVGPVLGGIAAAAAVVSGLKQVAAINSINLPKLAQGGAFDISGPSHAEGGVPVSIGNRRVAEVEGGEKMVILKRGSENVMQRLGMINEMAGGVNFYHDRSPRRFLADGGIVARSAASNVSQVSAQNIADSFKNITIVTKVADIDRINERRDIANTISELS